MSLLMLDSRVFVLVFFFFFFNKGQKYFWVNLSTSKLDFLLEQFKNATLRVIYVFKNNLLTVVFKIYTYLDLNDGLFV